MDCPLPTVPAISPPPAVSLATDPVSPTSSRARPGHWGLRRPFAPQDAVDIFKRQVAQEFIAGESLYALSKRHDISRQLIRVWVQKYEAGALDEDAQAADLLQEYEAKIAALERMVGRQALEIEFLKGALKNAPRPRSVNTSVIAGPAASPSQKDAG